MLVPKQTAQGVTRYQLAYAVPGRNGRPEATFKTLHPHFQLLSQTDVDTMGGDPNLAYRYLNEELQRREHPARQSRRISVPVPPMLEHVIGYDHNARYVGFRWLEGIDKPEYDDGKRSGTGNSWGFLLYMRHPAVSVPLQGYRLHIGSADEPAVHMLVLDRHERAMYVTTVANGRRFLQEQWPLEVPRKLTPEEEAEALAALAGGTWEEVVVDPVKLRQAMERDQMELHLTNNWLNGRIDNRQN